MSDAKTPAEALRWAAWLTLERGAVYAQESITPPMPPMDPATAYEYSLTCDVRAETLDDAGEALLSEAARLEALPPPELSDLDAQIIGGNVINTAWKHREKHAIEIGRTFLSELAADGFAIVRVRS